MWTHSLNQYSSTYWITRPSLSTTNLAVLLNVLNCLDYTVSVTKEWTWSTGGMKLKATENQCTYLLRNLNQCHFAHHKSHLPAKTQIFVLHYINPSRLNYRFSTKHQYCSSDTARCMQWVLHLLPTVEGVTGLQGVHERVDRPQSKLLIVLSAKKWNMIIFIVAAWMGKRVVPALLPVILTNKRNDRGMSCLNICHMFWMSGLVQTHGTFHQW
jgi:hypothetical protein